MHAIVADMHATVTESVTGGYWFGPVTGLSLIAINCDACFFLQKLIKNVFVCCIRPIL
jgi:hypothetical protein